MPDYLHQFLDKLVTSLPNVFTAVLILIVSLYLAQFLSNLLKKVLTRQKADREVTLLLAQLTRWSITHYRHHYCLAAFFQRNRFPDRAGYSWGSPSVLHCKISCKTSWLV